MDAQQCTCCQQFWASNSGPGRNFAAITLICPDCVARRLPVMSGLLR